MTELHWVTTCPGLLQLQLTLGCPESTINPLFLPIANTERGRVWWLFCHLPSAWPWLGACCSSSRTDSLCWQWFLLPQHNKPGRWGHPIPAHVGYTCIPWSHIPPGWEGLHLQQWQQSFSPLLLEVLEQFLLSRQVLEVCVTVEVLAAVDILGLTSFQQDLRDEEVPGERDPLIVVLHPQPEPVSNPLTSWGARSRRHLACAAWGEF